MTSFDYFRSEPGLRSFVYVLRPPAELRLPLTALSVACLAVFSAFGIERARLGSTLRIERAYLLRFEAQKRILAAAKIHWHRAEQLLALDRGIRVIARSGTQNARRLASIADDLPADAWLTQISPDPAGSVIQGRTRDWLGLADTMRRLERDSIAGEPELAAADMLEHVKPDVALRFTLRLRVPLETR